ncbi:hypothetical protein [Cysteiniphilum halobium]|uniref:hypothetical protein n=1 Tax=Cysteiniphilum halobium TaxID=2219059 RepID=UPI003F832D2C
MPSINERELYESNFRQVVALRFAVSVNDTINLIFLTAEVIKKKQCKLTDKWHLYE